MTTDRVSDDRLREIATAAEALHREEWGFVDSDEDTRILIVRAPNDTVVAASEDYKRASFIADCQPATVAALASELLALREAVTPFAALGQYILDEDLQTTSNDRPIWAFDRYELTFGDFRRIALLTKETAP